MANEQLPNIGADVVLEFQQSINNIRLFGEAMEGLDNRFGNMERRIDNLRSSLSSLSSQASRGSGRNLRTEMERELNNLVTGNGVVLSNIGSAPFRVDANTVRGVFNRVEQEINNLLARSYQNIQLQVNPNLNVGRIPIDQTDLDEVNRAIARLVRVQLNNLVAALRRHGAGIISPQDLSAIQFHVGRGTVQQIINRLKEQIVSVMLNPNIGQGTQLTFTDRDMDNIFRAIRNRVNTSVNNTIASINGNQTAANLAPNMQNLFNEVNNAARQYISNVTTGLNTISAGNLTKSINDVSNNLKRFMAKELGTDLASFNQLFANHQFSVSDLHAAELRRQFQSLERSLNRKIGGGMAEEVKEIVKKIDAIQISYTPTLHQYIVREINHINNKIVKKIREQIDTQFAHMRAEIDSVRVAPKDINRARRVRDMGRVEYDEPETRQRRSSAAPLANDPYARRDNYFNGFGLQGAVINTFRHILAGSIVGAPMMMLYQAFETFKTSQLEQVKMFSNMMFKDPYQTTDAQGNQTIDFAKVRADISQEVIPFIKEAAQFYAMDYGQATQVASIGSRVSETTNDLKEFFNVVGMVRAIDYEADPVQSIAPGIEAFKQQFGLAIGEMREAVVRPLVVATNVTNASTKDILDAISRSGSSFKEAGVDPKAAIALAAVTVQQTGQSGALIGNFYKTILGRLGSPETMKQLDSVGVDVYADEEKTKFRSADQILQDTARVYAQLTDPTQREIIQKAFGTYQSARGSATLNDFDKFVAIMNDIQVFNEDQFMQMMANNTQAPIIQMQRAGVSVDLALTSLMEEFSPEITKAANELTQFADAVRENRESIKQFISFLSSVLIGYAAVYGVRQLWNRGGFRQSIDNVRTTDSILGNNSRVAAWHRQGVLGGITQGISPMLLINNRQNRDFYTKAMRDKDLAPFVQMLAGMGDKDIERMNAYIRDNGLLINNHRDLLMTAYESRGYNMRPTNPDELRDDVNRRVYTLSQNKNKGVDQNFMQNFINDLRDKNRFEQLGQTQRGGEVINFLAGLDDSGLKGFNNHLEDIHARTGRVVHDIDSLSDAVREYMGIQQRNREELRRTSAEYRRLEDSIERVQRQQRQGNGMAGGLGGVFGGLSSMGRGIGANLLGFARMGLWGAAAGAGYALLGEFVKGMTYNVTTSLDERKLDEAQRGMEDIQKFANKFHQSWGTRVWGRFGEMWNDISDMFKEGNVDTGSGDIEDVGKEMERFITEVKKGDIGVGSKYAGKAREIRIAEWIRDQTEATGNENFEQDLLSEFGKWSGRSDTLKKAQDEAFKKAYAESIQAQINQAALQKEVEETRAERARKLAAEGDYSMYNFEERSKTVQEEVAKLEADSQVETLQALLNGMAEDSEEYINMRRNQSKEILALYQAEIDQINKMISDLTAKLEEAKRSGDKELIESLESQLSGAEDAKEQAQQEYQVQIDQRKLEDKQMEFDAALSRVTRSISNTESRFALADLENALTMDRNSTEYINATISNASEKIKEMQLNLEALRAVPRDDAEYQQVQSQINQMEQSIAQERVRIRDLQLTRIGAYKQDLSDSLAEISNEYLQAQVNMGMAGTDANNPVLRNLRINQYNRQIAEFDAVIANLQEQLKGTSDEQAQKDIQREIRDLQRQSLQAQLGILDEMKNTGGTFNLPDNVRAMSYYEYITRNNTHSTYTVQGGDTHVTISMPNITDGTSVERIRQIGKAFGEGYGEGRNLRLQKQANPFGYRG